MEENEETLALLQLGIEAELPAKKETVKIASNGTATAEIAAEEETMTSAATERLEAAKEKSPFVAQVIGEVCPDSVVEVDDEPMDDMETELLTEFQANDSDAEVERIEETPASPPQS